MQIRLSPVYLAVLEANQHKPPPMRPPTERLPRGPWSKAERTHHSSRTHLRPHLSDLLHLPTAV